MLDCGFAFMLYGEWGFLHYSAPTHFRVVLLWFYILAVVSKSVSFLMSFFFQFRFSGFF